MNLLMLAAKYFKFCLKIRSYPVAKAVSFLLPPYWLGTYLSSRSSYRLARKAVGTLLEKLGLKEAIIVSIIDGIKLAYRFVDLRSLFEVFELQGKGNPLKIPTDGCVIDLGAHIGAFSFKIAKLLKGGKVIAVEPHPENFGLLVENRKMNGFYNVTPINAAVSDANGTAKLFLDEVYTTGHSIELPVGKRFILVKTITLDALVKELGLSKVDLIKVDVEGAETKVLEGAGETLRLHKPRLIIEVHQPLSAIDRIVRVLSDNGYSLRIDHNGPPTLYAE